MTRDSEESFKNGTVAGQPPVPAPAHNVLRMSRNHSLNILGYSMPELHTGKCWYIDYYTLQGGSPVRHRIKVNRPKQLAQRKAYARTLVAELTAKLRRGWRPDHNPEAPKAHYTLGLAVEAFMAMKLKEVTLCSPDHYRSWARSFTRWAEKGGLLQKRTDAFTKADAHAYLDHLLLERQVGARTWNNNRVFVASLFNWLVEREYRATNPFKGIRKRKERRKVRVFLSDEDRVAIVAWLEENDPDFLVVCLFLFHAMIRPRELTRLLVHQVDLERMVITLVPEATKADREPEIVAIPDAMVPHLKRLRLQDAKPEWHVVGKECRPGPEPMHRNRYQDRWRRCTRALGLPDDRQFYSLRDTGIIQLLRDGVDLLHVMKHARHKNVRTTNEYLKHAFPKGIEEVRRKASSLRGGPGQ